MCVVRVVRARGCGVCWVLAAPFVLTPPPLLLLHTQPQQPREDERWQHDRYDGAAAAAPAGGLSTGGKLLVSNLDYNVTDDDMTVRMRQRMAAFAAPRVCCFPSCREERPP